jgi:hypothetical protein
MSANLAFPLVLHLMILLLFGCVLERVLELALALQQVVDLGPRLGICIGLCSGGSDKADMGSKSVVGCTSGHDAGAAIGLYANQPVQMLEVIHAVILI